MKKSVHLSDSILVFGGVYLLGIIFVVLLGVFFDLSKGLSILSLLAAAMITMSDFVTKNRRLPTPKEKFQLSALAYLSTFVISFFLSLAALVFMGELSSIIDLIASETSLFIKIFFFLSLTNIIALYILFSVFSKIYLKDLNNKKEVK